MTLRDRIPLWCVFALPLLALAAARGLWAPDEPRYAEVAKEAFEGRSLLVMHLNGEPYPDKPPLVFWLAGACGSLFGWEELALRMPSILATLASAWLTARLARRWLGAEEARWAPLFLLGSALPLWIGSRLQIDAVLSFFVLAAVERLSRTGTRRELIAHAAWAGLFAGLGGLAKGPVAWLHVALALVSWRLAPGPARFSPRRGKLAWALCAGLAVAPVALWAAAAAWREPEIARGLFFDQHLGRVSTEARHVGPPWQTLPQLLVWLVPTTLLVAGGCAQAWRGWRAARAGDASEAGTVRMALWLVSTLVVFSVLPPKRDLYLLPVYPAAALLAARAFVAGLRAGALPRWIARGTPAILALLSLALLCGPWLVAVARPFAVQGALVGLPLAGVALWGLRTRDVARWASVQWLGLAGVVVWARLVLVPAIDDVKCVDEFARSLAAVPGGAPVVFVGVKPEGYRFYAGIEGIAIERKRAEEFVRDELARESSFRLVTRAEDLELFPADLLASLREVDRSTVGSNDVRVLSPAPRSAAPRDQHPEPGSAPR